MQNDLQLFIIRLEAGAQICAETSAGFAKAGEMLSAAQELRAILEKHGAQLPACRRYENKAAALAAYSEHL